MKIIYWKLQAGKEEGQESFDLKYQKGLEYVEKLKQAGEDVVEVVEDKYKLKIIIREIGDEEAPTE